MAPFSALQVANSGYSIDSRGFQENRASSVISANSSAIKFTNVFLQNIRKQSLYQDVFCGEGGRLRASLQGIRETTKYRIRIKSKDSRGLTR